MLLVRLNNDGDIIGYPFSLGLLRIHYPEIPKYTIPSEATLASYNAFVVELTTGPSYDIIYERLEEGLPVLINGKWKQNWNIRAATQVEIEEAKEQIKEQISKKTQERLDSFAQSLGYDHIVSVCTYKDSTVLKFQKEGTYCSTKRDQTWNKLIEIYNDVIAGTRDIPRSFEEIVSELPTLDITEI